MVWVSQMCQGDNDRCGILPWLNNLPIQYVDMTFDWFQNILTPRENGGGGGNQASAIHTGAGGRAAWLNSIFSVFGYDQNNPLPSCFGDVFLRTAADDLNPFTPSAGDVAKVAIGVGAAAQFNRALDYAAGRGLTSPFKSSVFRKLIGSSRQLVTIAESAPLIYMVFSLGHGLLTEIRSLDRGECQ